VLANKASQQNNSQDTILHLLEALLIDPGYKDARLRLIESYLSNGQRESAEEALRQAVINNPDASEFVAMRTRLLVEDGDLQHASLLLDNALTRFESDEELLVLGASINDQLGNYIKAASLYEQLTLIDPTKLSYQVGQAMAMDHAGDGDTATILYQIITQKLADSGTRLPFIDQRLLMLTSTADDNLIQ
jgi:Tfp pilus assembly protein PilF